MRVNRQQKRNPNPPWPSEQAVVVVPPGSGAAAIGNADAETRVMPGSVPFSEGHNLSVNTDFERSEGMPIMGYAGNSREETGRAPQRMIKDNEKMLMDVSKYLSKSLGNYAKVEFLFGENTHIEKNGILKTVGKDFIVLEEAGSKNNVICSAKNIKFINIYNMK